ncbi:DUF6527 family protein [Ralstonia sp. TCR112]|uniref:DUF6527 family protein n=1 Tax=Ralstonia sp. TCR112 TaxID=2601730 RepID=UPI003965C4AA
MGNSGIGGGLKQRARIISWKGQVAHRHEADAHLKEPGDVVLVHRGLPRSMAMACPDGCGETLTINLDSRAGPAWRHYIDDTKLTLYPSVWRDTGCKSHFIVWRSKIFWCDWQDPLDGPTEELEAQTQAFLTEEFVPYIYIADQLNQIPWAVLSACWALVRSGIAEAGKGTHHGMFRLRR